MVNFKVRHVLYHYGPDSAAKAKELAIELRAAGGNARTIDAASFADIEDADKIEYVGDFPPSVLAMIQAAYEGSGKPLSSGESPLNADGTPAIDIPQDWEQLSFPEMQKLAAALSNEAVRSKEAAMEVILAELERREASVPGDDDLDGMTRAQLIEYAEEHEIDLGKLSKKSDILAAIRADGKE